MQTRRFCVPCRERGEMIKEKQTNKKPPRKPLKAWLSRELVLNMKIVVWA